MKVLRMLSLVLGMLVAAIACQKTEIQESELDSIRAGFTLDDITSTVPGEPCTNFPYVITLVRKMQITEGPHKGMWEYSWSVVNPNPGNGENGTVQDLSHWGITLPDCINLGNIKLAKAMRFGDDVPTQFHFYEVFTPRYEADKSFNANGVCPGAPQEPVMLKFNYGTVRNYPTYYVLVIDKDLPVDPDAVAYYKSGKVTGACSICFPGLGCPEDPVTSCSFSQGRYFASPHPWPAPGTVTLGGKTYTEAEGRAIWQSSNRGGISDAKKAFHQAAAIKLSASTISSTASVLADVKIIEDWLATLEKLTPTNHYSFTNKAAADAAGRIGDWIEKNHCEE